MRARLFSGLTVFAVVLGAAIAIAGEPPAEAPSVRLGEHLATIGGCSDCHTPWKMGPKGPEPDLTRLYSGHPADVVIGDGPPLDGKPWLWAANGSGTAFAGPWGITFAPNLTPDENTGMGIWTEEMFVRAMRTGRHMGQSREIMPPMPWRAFAAMTDHELRSVFAYLRTLPPIKNAVPEYRPPGPVE